MIFRALLISLLIHGVFLLASPTGKVLARLEGRSIEVRGVLTSQDGRAPTEEATATPSVKRGRLPERKALATAAPSAHGKQAVAERGSQLAPPRPEITLPLNGEEGSADALRQYRLNLARAARHFKQSRASPHEYAREGTVVVLLRLEASSPDAGVELGASSGDHELDADALLLAARAAGVTMIPDGLKGRSLAVELAIRYGAGDR